MKATLRVDVSDWTDNDVGLIPRGTKIIVERLNLEEQALLNALYLAKLNIGTDRISFTLDRQEFDIDQ